jgi:trk system potassium uptake protein TrkH
MVEQRTVFFFSGLLISGLGIALIFPLCLDFFLFCEGIYPHLLFCEFAYLTLAGSLILGYRSQESMHLKPRDAFLVTGVSWIVLPLLASIPFYGVETFYLSGIDCWFEAVSSLTTTGSTIISNLKAIPKSILLWRSILQWLGGLGIVITALALLPMIRSGGVHLIHHEFSDRSEKILPRASKIIVSLAVFYGGVTFSCLCLLKLMGMSWFDSFCHAFSTISTGGLSNYDESVRIFQSPCIEWVLIFFMIIGGTPLMMYAQFFQKGFRKNLLDPQVRTYLFIIFCSSLLLMSFRVHNIWDLMNLDTVRRTVFTCVSVITSTGFIIDNYESWGTFPIMLLFLLGLLGGCTGSTAGGLKIYRIYVLAVYIRCYFLKLLRPSGVYIPTYQGKALSQEALYSVFTFLILYIFCWFVFSLILSMLGLDFASSMTGSAAALANLGPGLGPILGPNSLFSSISSSVKMVLMLAMILGRLEIITFLVLCLPSFWKR